MNNRQEINSRNNHRQSEQITNKGVTHIKKKDILKALKKAGLMGVLAGGILTSALFEAKDAIDTHAENRRIEKSLEEVDEEVFEILKDHKKRLETKFDKGKTMYEHSDIACDIQDIAEEKGNVYANAVIAEMADSIEETGYKNMDRVIRVFDRRVKNMEEYAHLMGYETIEEFQKAADKDFYELKQVEAVQEKYYPDVESEETKSYGRGN